MASQHVVLIGDSILDNKRYVGSRSPDVAELFSDRVNKRGWRVTNEAVDGARTEEVIASQIDRIPKDTTIVILSTGGNDGLFALGRLQNIGFTPWGIVAEINHIRNDLRMTYRTCLQRILDKKVALIALTVYRPYFVGNAPLQWLCNLGVYFMNAMIADECRRLNRPVIDLRVVFDKAEDYANSIEPGVPGADKIINNALHIIDSGKLREFAVYSDRTHSEGFNFRDHIHYWSRKRFEVEGPNSMFRRVIGDHETLINKLLLATVAVAIGGVALWWWYSRR